MSQGQKVVQKKEGKNGTMHSKFQLRNLTKISEENNIKNIKIKD